MSSLDREVPISGWRVQWLNRDLPAYLVYTNAVSFTLAIGIFVLGVVGFFGIRSCNKRLKAEPENRRAIFKSVNKHIVKVCRGHWAIAILYLLNVLVIGVADAFIGVSAVKDDLSENPEVVSKQFILELAAYAVYVMALFMMAFTVVPLIQVVFATGLLARFARKRGITSLSAYLPEARMYSTHIAQLWSMAAFFMMAWWPADQNLGSRWFPLRWVLLQGIVGSALAWLDASFAFNFCYDRLNNKDIDVGASGITDVVRLFGKTMKTAHSLKATEADALPLYNASVDEKTPLTADESRQLE